MNEWMNEWTQRTRPPPLRLRLLFFLSAADGNRARIRIAHTHTHAYIQCVLSCLYNLSGTLPSVYWRMWARIYRTLYCIESKWWLLMSSLKFVYRYCLLFLSASLWVVIGYKESAKSESSSGAGSSCRLFRLEFHQAFIFRHVTSRWHSTGQIFSQRKKAPFICIPICFIWCTVFFSLYDPHTCIDELLSETSRITETQNPRSLHPPHYHKQRKKRSPAIGAPGYA